MEIRRYQSLQEHSRYAAKFICELARKCVRQQGFFTLVLSGGNTPRMLYELLAQSPFNDNMPWSHTHIFWGDERCVGPDHPDSNFLMAYRALISKVNMPSENIHRMPVEIKPSQDAALAYEQILREFFTSKAVLFSSSTGGEMFPSFDLILLGIGVDGHTASLFPGDPVLEEKERWVAAVCAPAGVSPEKRITLTLPVINRASCVVIQISGKVKMRIFDTILNDRENASRLYPAARVHPLGQLIWFADVRAQSLS